MRMILMELYCALNHRMIQGRQDRPSMIAYTFVCLCGTGRLELEEGSLVVHCIYEQRQHYSTGTIIDHSGAD